MNEASRSVIDVESILGPEDHIEVKHEAVIPETKRELGQSAIEYTRYSVPLEAATPQMLKKALGSPYREDDLGRIVPKDN